MKIAFVIPAYDVGSVIGEVVSSLVDLNAEIESRGSAPQRVIVVDDGSRDATAANASAAGAEVLIHAQNLGKGAALRTGLRRALELGAEVVVSVDGDGQHPASGVLRVALSPAPSSALVLGIRNMRADGAPRSSQLSNRIANYFVGRFTAHHFRDSQCGLRRYPLPSTLQLGVKSSGYAFETEVLLRALHFGLSLVEEPIQAYYPAPDQRISHFRVVKDPWRIVRAVVRTLVELHLLPDTSDPPKLRGHSA